MYLKKLLAGLILVSSIMLLNSCEDEESTNPGIIPDNFKVDIPSSLSKDMKSATYKSAEEDGIDGNEIYSLLNLFIAVGEGAADLVEEIMTAIKVHNIENVTDLTFTSDEDSRQKHLIVTKDAQFDGVTWEYMLTVTDLLSESEDDGGIGMQVFWNNSPVEGIAIFKPYNNNHEDADQGDAVYKITYSAKGNDKYDEYMLVEIADLPLTSDQFSINNLKMFAGKKDDIVDVYGNSNHPNAQFNAYDDEAKGFNWAFVASSDETENIAVAELGLPANDANISTRQEILIDNSVKVVYTREITNSILELYPSYTEAEVTAYLVSGGLLDNLDAPGYFNNNGFIQAKTSPGTQYDIIGARILNLTPFVPAEVNELSISFKN